MTERMKTPSARRTTPAQLDAEIAAVLKRKNTCVYCGKPTRKGSLVMDEGQTAHRSCYAEFEKD